MRGHFPERDLLGYFADSCDILQYPQRRNYRAVNRDQHPAPFNASDAADQAAPGIFQHPDMRREILRHSHQVYFHVAAPFAPSSRLQPCTGETDPQVAKNHNWKFCRGSDIGTET